MLIVRDGRPVRGFALSDDALTAAAADLATMQRAATRADELAAGGDPFAAVQAYQAIGDNGAVVLGPKIDAAGGALDVTQPLTQHAWLLNGSLAVIAPQPPATSVDVESARRIAREMLDDYRTAIDRARATQNAPASEQPTKPPVWPWIVVPIVLVGGGLVVWLRR
jgi:hypothetical protein